MLEEKDVEETSVTDLLTEAKAESSTTETEAKEAEKSTVAAEKSGDNRIPYKRFVEVNDALKEEKATGVEARAQLIEAQTSLVDLQKLLAASADDVQTLNEIKSYANDPTMEAHVRAIDNRLKGISDEVESGESTPEEALEKTRQLLSEAKEEVLDVKADVQAEGLTTKADIIYDKLLDALPEEYNEQDRNTVSDLMAAKMDEQGWDKAIADPDNLSTILTEQFQETLNRYGTPRGALLTKEEVDESTTEVVTEATPEQEVADILGKDWGEVKEVTTKSGTVTKEPVYNDAAFTANLTTLLKHANANKK
jgi:hypothetical protein